jgi:hypothetical protein
VRTRLITEAALEQEKTPEDRRADARYRFTHNNGGKSRSTESLNRSAALMFSYSTVSNSA